MKPKTLTKNDLECYALDEYFRKGNVEAAVRYLKDRIEEHGICAEAYVRNEHERKIMTTNAEYMLTLVDEAFPCFGPLEKVHQTQEKHGQTEYAEDEEDEIWNDTIDGIVKAAKKAEQKSPKPIKQSYSEIVYGRTS
jgi:hypothetical protein